MSKLPQERIFLEVESRDEAEVLRKIALYEGIVSEAGKRGIIGASSKVQKAARVYIERGGIGWKKRRNVSIEYQSVPDGWKKKRRDKGTVYFLSKFVRFVPSENGESAEIDFGKTRSGENGKFDRGLIKIAKRVQERREYRVTPELRRKFAAIGYPLPNTRKKLVDPKRPILDKVYSRSQTLIEDSFVESMGKDLEKQSKRNDL